MNRTPTHAISQAMFTEHKGNTLLLVHHITEVSKFFLWERNIIILQHRYLLEVINLSHHQQFLNSLSSYLRKFRRWNEPVTIKVNSHILCNERCVAKF